MIPNRTRMLTRITVFASSPTAPYAFGPRYRVYTGSSSTAMNFETTSAIWYAPSDRTNRNR